ncbi:hypothetical protein [Sphingomonas sp.]|jgi:hypothetical protein|uniref:hypothetical protein n=1 Tax=Sphingomonas sp. TaxID=28214 RepID=UPI002EDB1F85
MFKNQPPIFETGSKPEISLTMTRIREWQDHGFGLNASYFERGEIEGGHEAIASGEADDFWRGGKQIVGKKLRMHVKFHSDLSRRQTDRGIIGGGQFYDEYVDIELNLEPQHVREVVHELRLSAVRQLFVGGYAISPKIFRATRFGLSEPRGGQPV